MSRRYSGGIVVRLVNQVVRGLIAMVGTNEGDGGNSGPGGEGWLCTDS